MNAKFWVQIVIMFNKRNLIFESFQCIFRKCILFKCVALVSILALFYITRDLTDEPKIPLDEKIMLLSFFDPNERTERQKFLQYAFIHTNQHICRDAKRNSTDTTLKAVVLIKSSINKRKHRDVLRRTWMSELRYKNMVGVFLLGMNSDGDNRRIDLEQQEYGDIVQQDFIDTYYNNTIKAILGWRWATTYCDSAKFIVHFDDDIIVHVERLSKFLDERINRLLSEPNQLIGFIYNRSIPERRPRAKWYLSHEEYPWSNFPPYPSAGAYIISMNLTKSIYEISLRARLLRFDDVFLGILALKLKIILEHEHGIDLTFRGCPNIMQIGFACHTDKNLHRLEEIWKRWKLPLIERISQSAFLEIL